LWSDVTRKRLTWLAAALTLLDRHPSRQDRGALAGWKSWTTLNFFIYVLWRNFLNAISVNFRFSFVLLLKRAAALLSN
jgi:hypothetical protein